VVRCRKPLFFALAIDMQMMWRSRLNNLYAQWCKQKSLVRKDPFAFKCTAAGYGNDALPDFKGSASSHFIATTVELLTTGVDVPAVRNIAFFRYLKSPISFYQMIGRGTRIDEPTGKLMFTVHDYTGATRLFGLPHLCRNPRGRRVPRVVRGVPARSRRRSRPQSSTDSRWP
jgi:type I site-specific restriction endonuclease